MIAHIVAMHHKYCGGWAEGLIESLHRAHSSRNLVMVPPQFIPKYRKGDWCAMIERLKESGGWAYGFKVMGQITEDDVKAFEPQMQFAIRERGKKPLGIVVDATELKHMDWKARWEELRFLHRYSDHIARVALVGASKWEEVETMFLGATVLAEADIRYFEAGEMQQAWMWARGAKHTGDVPVRQIYRGGIWKDYQEEFNL